MSLPNNRNAHRLTPQFGNNQAITDSHLFGRRPDTSPSNPVSIRCDDGIGTTMGLG
jgi:hypothetical protein